MNQKIEICYAKEEDVPDIMSVMDISCQLARMRPGIARMMKTMSESIFMKTDLY